MILDSLFWSNWASRPGATSKVCATEDRVILVSVDYLQQSFTVFWASWPLDIFNDFQ